MIKIDVEGAEHDVLEGAPSVLSQARPVVIFEHVASAAAPDGAPPAACWDLLVELGYQVFWSLAMVRSRGRRSPKAP